MSSRGSSDPQHGRSPLTRRRLVASGLSGALLLSCGLTGCTPSDPRISADSPPPSVSASGAPASGSSSSRPPSARPSPVAPAVRSSSLAAGEQRLADLAAAALTGPHRSDLSSGQRRLLAALRDAHLQHATALRSPQPTSRPLSPAASAEPAGAGSKLAKLSLTKSLSLLARQERQQAGRARRVALGTAGLDALLAGSVMVSATSYAGAVTTTSAATVTVSDKAHQPVAAVSDVEGVQSMVRQLHAIVYGYQIALGHLPQSTSQGRRALAALGAHRAMRDRLEQELVERSATVPAAAGAYVPSVAPTSRARSTRLIRHMEVALQPFCGLWVASATNRGDRALALTTLARTAGAAHAWGAPLSVWPGWQD